MASLPTRHQPPTTVPSTTAYPTSENESNDNVVAALTIHDHPSGETNPEAYAGDANVEAVAAAEAELARVLVEHDKDVHPACNESMWQQMRVVSQVFSTFVARMDEREAQMEALVLRMDGLGRIFRELAAELRAEKGEWTLPRRRDS